MNNQKVALVTGAGSGIGASVAKRFANNGFAVVLNGRTESKLQAVAEGISNTPVLTVPGDVSNQEDVKNLIAKTVETFGRIDVVVNNAAIAVFQPINEISLDDWNTQLGINVTGPFLVTKEAMPYLEKYQGSIVNVSSVSGIGGDWGGFAYNTTKGAINLMTKGLALELGPKNVRINAVAPSLTDTDMAAFVTENDSIMADFKDRIPMQRAAKPEEVSDVIAFLASDEARFVNGAILTVDGGLNASNGQPNMSKYL